MVTTGGDVLQGALGLLNDLNQAIYKEAKMLPLINKTYRELQLKLTALGVRVTHELTTLITVRSGVDTLTFGSGLPADLLSPVRLFERADGSGSGVKYADMFEQTWQPDLTICESLIYWVWQEEELHFPGANTDRQVMLRYKKSLGVIKAVTSPILITDADVWMAQRVASMAALLIGNNPKRAEALTLDLKDQWDNLKAIKVAETQSLPTRRRRTRYRAR